MLTLDQLKKYYPDNPSVSLKNMLVEYIQHEILDSLFKQPESRQLSFIGGTALRIVYAGTRFSEDLDFDNFGLSFETFQTLSKHIVSDMELKGFSVEFRTIEKGAYHCYVKFPHILQAASIGGAPGEKILVRIDTMRKEENFTPSTFTLNRFDIYRDIRVNPIDVLLAQKLITIVERKREKGRDFFDTSYLYGMTQPNFEYLEKTTKMDRTAFIQKVFDRCDQLDFHKLAKDVEPFLLRPEQVTRVSGFREFIYKTLK
jgi:predicted nucleotidyltransferase component of viral defense system